MNYPSISKRATALLAAVTITALTLTGCGPSDTTITPNPVSPGASQPLTPGETQQPQLSDDEQRKADEQQLLADLSVATWEGTVLTPAGEKAADITFTLNADYTVDVAEWQAAGTFTNTPPESWLAGEGEIWFYLPYAVDEFGTPVHADYRDNFEVTFTAPAETAGKADTITFTGVTNLNDGGEWTLVATRL